MNVIYGTTSTTISGDITNYNNSSSGNYDTHKSLPIRSILLELLSTEELIRLLFVFSIGVAMATPKISLTFIADELNNRELTEEQKDVILNIITDSPSALEVSDVGEITEINLDNLSNGEMIRLLYNDLLEDGLLHAIYKKLEDRQSSMGMDSIKKYQEVKTKNAAKILKLKEIFEILPILRNNYYIADSIGIIGGASDIVGSIDIVDSVIGRNIVGRNIVGDGLNNKGV